MIRMISKYLIFGMVLVFALSLFGCSGDDGDQGPAGPKGDTGPPGPASSGALSGTLTNTLSGAPVSGVEVVTDPVIENLSISSDNGGAYSASLPLGNYTLTFSKAHFESATRTVSILAGETAVADVSLEPVEPVVVDLEGEMHAAPGENVSISASAEVLDGSADAPVFSWKQISGPRAAISESDSPTITATLADVVAYKAALVSHLNAPDRFMVQAVNPFALEEAEKTVFQVSVSVGGRTYTREAEVMAELPYGVNPGLRTLPVGAAVLLHGKTQDAYDWQISGPPGTAAALNCADSQNPCFTPDVLGKYILTETVSGTILEVYAGTWVGVITGQDQEGRPVADSGCLKCHDGNDAPDQFTPWAQSGHAEIFTDNLDTSTYYGESCFPCHMVGFDPAVANGGVDDQADYPDFLESGLLRHPGDNWTATLASYPDTARHANIQCENCHGPQKNEGAHNAEGHPRTSLSSDVCATCHGEPKRHARFQQWEESAHGSFELALEEGPAGGGKRCSPCHTANGFVQWAAMGFHKDAEIPEGVSEDEVQPVTCAACHDPHRQGKTSGKPNTATVRLENDTPELKGGFVATGVGRGALCMVCHNSRRAPYSTSLYGKDHYAGNPEMIDHSTHGGPQADILMGENGFFVTPGARGAHSFIKDSCTNCHMELTDPPADLSYNLGGTNHTFEASPKICSECHGVFDGGTLRDTVDGQLRELETLITEALKKDIETIAASATGVLLNYNASENTYDAIINASGEDAHRIASLAAQHEYPHGYDVTLGNGMVASTAHKRIVVWQDANGDGIVDPDEVKTGDTNGQGIADSMIGGIPTNGQNIVKAKWNHDLVDADGSHGIHNPGFVRDILNESVNALRR